MRWHDPQPVEVSGELRSLVGGHPLVAERLVRAGLGDPAAAQAFLDPQAYQPSSPFELPDLEIGAARLERAIREGEPILIWGDFDVDGQTATALLFTALRQLGANVRYHVPLRDGEGHGMHLPRLREWLGRGIRVIVTCDTGITSHEAVIVAREAGVDVVITDHHLLGETLPPAHAVINPMRLPEGHRLRELPGVGVAYQLIKALAENSRLDDLLDLVALGIVADVAVQRNETRYLLQRGLEVMRLTTRIGLRAMIDGAGIDPLELDEGDIAFSLGPRLNAQGRLGDARDSVELLATRDPVRAAELASQLEGMNARRRLESTLIEESAHSLLDKDPAMLEYAAIVLSHPEWSGGIVGIVANRLADLYHKPVILLGEKDDVLSGSARSVAGCNITEALRGCADLLLKFGGHAMAAGLSLRRNDLFEFRRRLSRAVRESLPQEAGEPVLGIDGYVGLGEISLAQIKDWRRLAPFGNGNPPLTLATRDLRLASRRKLGRRGDHLELILEDAQGTRQRALWWKAGEAALPSGRFDLAYYPRISRFRGQPEAVLEVVDLLAREGEVVEVTPSAPACEIENYRHHPQSEEKLVEILSRYPDAIVWREGEIDIAGRRRTELTEAETLIVWTAPPGPVEWQAALDRVKPRRIVFFGQCPPELSVEQFLQKLGGLLKFALKARAGETTIAELAGALAQREDAVRHGLRWFAQGGQIAVDIREDGAIKVKRLEGGEAREQSALEGLLRGTLEETAAYRKNWIPALG